MHSPDHPPLNALNVFDAVDVVDAIASTTAPATAHLPDSFSSPALRAPWSAESLPSPARLTSFICAAVFGVMVLLFNLLPGLLAASVGYLLVVGLSKMRLPANKKLPTLCAAAIIIGLPLVLLIVFGVYAKGMVLSILDQYDGFIMYLSKTALELRDKLPSQIATHLPSGIFEVKKEIESYVKSNGSAVAGFGRAGLHGMLLAAVGLVIGALIPITDKVDKGKKGDKGGDAAPHAALFRHALLERAQFYIETFHQIVLAQFWIAVINASCTAVFLWFALPLFGVSMPYSAELVALTFFAGLLPILGNVVCNIVITMLGLSISPVVGLSCLVFLILVHELEYVVNANVLGRQTNTAAWELLTVMFVGEAIFGLPGIVAAPLYYAYLKKELHASKVI